MKYIHLQIQLKGERVVPVIQTGTPSVNSNEKPKNEQTTPSNETHIKIQQEEK